MPVQDVGQGEERNVLGGVGRVVERGAKAVDGLVSVTHNAPVQRGCRAQHPRRRILSDGQFGFFVKFNLRLLQ